MQSLQISEVEGKRGTEFAVRAQKKGNYKLVALLMEKSGKIIKSNRVDLEVYEHLSSIPLEILV